MSWQLDRRVFLTATAAAAGCAHSRKETSIVWEHHMISSGANRPDFNVEAPADTEALVALHQGGGTQPAASTRSPPCNRVASSRTVRMDRSLRSSS